MCFIEKMNCIRIRKREDRVLDPVRTLSRVGYWGTSSSQKVTAVKGVDMKDIQSNQCSRPLQAKEFQLKLKLRMKRAPVQSNWLHRSKEEKERKGMKLKKAALMSY